VVPTFDHFLLLTRLTRRPAQPVAEHHGVRPAPGPHADEPQVGFGHAIDGAMVAGHDLGADHQVEFVDQPVGQQVGPEGLAAEVKASPSCSRSLATAS
jgi:hypothetical protein